MQRILFILIVLVLMPFAYAHLSFGTEQTFGNVLIDFGYNPRNPTMDEVTELSFWVQETYTRRYLYPTKAKVTIYNKERDVLFDQEFTPVDGKIDFTHTFDQYGLFNMTYTIWDGETVMASSSIQVPMQKKPFDRFTFFKIAAGVGLGLLVLVLIGKWAGNPDPKD